MSMNFEIDPLVKVVNELSDQRPDKDAYVRLGCEGCKSAVSLVISDKANPDDIYDATNNLPGTRRGYSYTIKNQDVVCDGREDCPFEGRISQAKEQLLALNEKGI